MSFNKPPDSETAHMSISMFSIYSSIWSSVTVGCAQFRSDQRYSSTSQFCIRLRQIASTQHKPIHTKPGRRHEKASWLHQEIPVVHMALGWARGKLGLPATWASNLLQADC
jgi:hypothetical protein